MDYSICLDTINLAWLNVPVKGSRLDISKLKCSLEIVFILANSVDPDEMLHSDEMLH